MLSLPPSVRVYLARGVADMRKSIDGLTALTTQILEQDPFSGHLGRVVDQHGVGIADASVDLRGTADDSARLLDADEHARRRPPYHAVSRDTRTDADGRFRFADLAAGTYDLSVSVRGGPEGEREGVRVEAGRTTSGVDIALDLGRTIAGNVVTDDGSPLEAEHVSVTIRAAGDDEGMDRWVQVQRDGSFRVVGLADGRYAVQVAMSHWANDELPPWLGSEVGDVAAGREDLRLVLHRAAVITGKVVDAAGLPRKGVAVTAVGPGIDHQGARSLTRDDGTFRLLLLPGTVCDLRYGGSPDPTTGKEPEYPGVSAGTTGLVLVLK